MKPQYTYATSAYQFTLDFNQNSLGRPPRQRRSTLHHLSKRVNTCQTHNYSSRSWSHHEKVSYGKLLLSYLIKDLDVNPYFIQHLAQLLDRTPKDIYVFHLNMLAEYRTSLKIVSRLLKCKYEKLMREMRERKACLEYNAKIEGTTFADNQVQELLSHQVAYLEKLMMAENSLEDYEQDYDEGIQIFQLDDQQEQFEKEENTNDSMYECDIVAEGEERQ